MKPIAKIILGVTAAVVIVILAVVMSIQPVVVGLVKAEFKEREMSFTEQGFVIKNETVDVYPTVNGEILTVMVKEGDNVKKGDIICIVDKLPYEVEKKQIISAIDGYKAQIDNLKIDEQRTRDDLVYSKKQLQSELNILNAKEKSGNVTVDEQLRLQNIIISQSEKDLALAKETFDKSKVLYENGILSKIAFENAENDLKKIETLNQTNKQKLLLIEEEGKTEDFFASSKSAINAQIQRIDNTISKSYITAMADYYNALIESNESSIELLDKKINDCEIKAFSDGEIELLYAKNTNIVSSSAPVASIKEISKTNNIEVYVSTKDIDSIIDENVKLTLKRQAGDLILNGKIVKKSSDAEIRISSLGLEERRVKIEIEQTDADKFLINPGYEVDVKFTTFRDEGITVPKTAIFKDAQDDKDYVFILKRGKAVKTEITKGAELRTEYIVISGVNEGDTIIKDCEEDGVKEGVRIK